MNILTEFVRWAAAQQIGYSNSRYRVSVVLASPTAKRSAALEIEEFEIEPNGWVTTKLILSGSLMLWESGEVDATVGTEALRDRTSQVYAEHWDGAQPSGFDDMFTTFLSHFPLSSGGELEND